MAWPSTQSSDEEIKPGFEDTELPPSNTDFLSQLKFLQSFLAPATQQYYPHGAAVNQAPILLSQKISMPQPILMPQPIAHMRFVQTNHLLGPSLQMRQIGPNTGTQQLERRNFGRMKMKPLKESPVPPEIADIEEKLNHDPKAKEEWLSIVLKFSRIRKDAKKYIDAYKTMIYLEEAKQSKFLTQFNTENIQLERSPPPGQDFCFRNDARTSKISDAVNENLLDFFTLTAVKSPTDSNTDPNFIPLSADTSLSVTGQIKSCNKYYIFVRFTGESLGFMSNGHNLNRKFNIAFHVNRTPFQLEHNVLERMRELDLFDCLINNPLYAKACTECIDYDSYFFKGKLASNLNEEQRKAVSNIVKSSSFPLPYLLYGPAGTGKTKTLIAAIEEIVLTSDKHILVCANSNAACDEITERLMQVMAHDQMFRLYTSSYNAKKMNERFKSISNWDNDNFSMPPLADLYEFRVLICTLITAGNVARDAQSQNLKTDHFSHVIIDECASTHEPTTLIPIVQLCSAKGEIKSSLVLAGDPQQLDAVTKSICALKLGYNVSFMQHLLDQPLYKPNPKTGEYNQNYITQLVKNYRSHSAILQAANMLFYENRLQVSADTNTTNWYIGSELLPTKNFPVVFHSVKGYASKTSKDNSLCNQKETSMVMDYIRTLLKCGAKRGISIRESHIGVVTPYKSQCRMIHRACIQNSFKDITVGTAEVFQGQERPIMIVSTVCTNGKLGFVDNPRRMNVIITRARSLLIVIGNERTLREDKNWSALIEYCKKNKAFIQGERAFSH